MKNFIPFLIIVLFAFNSCKKELKSIQLDRDEITMHYDESIQINVSYSPTDVDIPPVFTWFSENTKVAEVNQSGLVEGVKIGETNIQVQTEDAKFQAACKVIVEPKSNLYKEPIIEFGQTKSYVKSKETRLIDNEVSNSLLYKGENSKVRYVMYLFDYDMLESSAVMLVSNVAEEVATFLIERYDIIGEIDNIYLFRVNSSVVVGITYDISLGLIVMYIEYESTKSTYSLSNFYKEKLAQLQQQYLNDK
jgi:hypothetical protein